MKLRPEDGSRVAEIKLADELRSSPTISYDGTIYVNGMKDDKPTVFAVKGCGRGAAPRRGRSREATHQNRVYVLIR